MAYIALLTIATNKYIQFANPLYDSVQAHFLEGHEVDIFLFTNDPHYEYYNLRGQFIKQEIVHRPFPMMTLMRYDMFERASRRLEAYDYIFYCDIDMLFVDKVGDEILPKGLGLVSTVHPGFWDKHRMTYTYERNPNSLAYVKSEEGKTYYAGGFQGGGGEAYLKAIETLSRNINQDMDNGIIAVWHDESHWNRYLIDNPPEKRLSPSYCYPESWNLPFKKRLLALDKNHEEIRRESDV